jgi:hypothetical protein
LGTIIILAKIIFHKNTKNSSNNNLALFPLRESLLKHQLSI